MNLGSAFIEFMPTLPTTAVKGLTQEATKAGAQVGDALTESMGKSLEKSKSVLEKGKSLFALTGVGLGLSLGEAFTKTLDVSAANSKMAKQLNLTKDQASKFGKASGQVYASGFGNSMEDVNASISEVVRNIPNIKNASVPVIKDVTSSALALAKTFDQDVGKTTQAVGQLMRTGLAKNATEAFDLITTGLQKVPNAGEDLLDTFNEYGVQFQKLGLKGPEALGLINQLMQGGARNTDLAADAIKEFSIRAIDGSKTSAEGFKILGLNADKMTAAIAKGGPSAKTAFGEVLNRLNSIEDPVKRNTAGVNLFGTQWEDLGAAFKKANLDTAAASLGKIEGANKAIKATDPKQTIDNFSRAIQVAFVDILGNKVLPLISKFIGFVKEHSTAFKAAAIAATALGVAYAAVSAAMAIQAAGGFAAFIKGVVTSTKLWAAAQWLLNAAMTANPIGIVVVAITALVAALVIAYKNSETFRNIVNQAWAAVKTAIGAVVDWFVKTAWPGLKAAWDAVAKAADWLWKNALKPAWEGIKTAVDVAWKAIQAILKAGEVYIKTWAAIFTWLWHNVIEPVWNGIKLAIQVAWVAIQIIFKSIEIAVKLLGTLFNWFWNSVIKPVWDGIKNTITTVWNAIKTTVLDIWSNYIKGPFTQMWQQFSIFLQNLWNVLKTFLTNTWNTVKTTVFDAWQTYIKGPFMFMWTQFKQGFEILWNAIRTFLVTTWTAIKTTVLDVWANYIKGPFTAMWNAFKAFITTLWNVIKTMLQAAWNWIRDNVFRPIVNYIDNTFKPKWEFLRELIRRTWNNVKTDLKTGWDWIKNNVFNPISNFVTKTIPDAFSKGIGFIKTAWSKLTDIVQNPVKTFVDKVINGWIIEGFNRIASKVGVGTISKIALASGGLVDRAATTNIRRPGAQFATGGVMPGYTPGKDVHQFMSPTGGRLELSGGEAVMRPEWTRAMGSGYVDTMNRIARISGTSGVKAAMGYAKGGVIQSFRGGGILETFSSWWEDITGMAAGVADVIRLITGGVKGVTGASPYLKDIFTNAGKILIEGVKNLVTADSSGGGGGDSVAVGNAGTSKGQGWAWEKAVLTAAGFAPRITSTTGGDHAKGSYHYRGRAVDIGNDSMAMFNWIVANYGSITKELIYGPAGRNSLRNGAKHWYGTKLMREHMDHIHWAVKKGGILGKAGLFDEGGWLQSGNIGVNLSRKPEAVLTPEESAGLKGMAAGELLDKLDELIDAVEKIAPGVGGYLRGSGRGAIAIGRSV